MIQIVEQIGFDNFSSEIVVTEIPEETVPYPGYY